MSRSEREACVDAFAWEMKNKLTENAHKGDREGWMKCTTASLMRRLREEVEELGLALDACTADDGQPRIDAERVTREAADVGNFAMMIADRVGGLVGVKENL